MTDKKKACPVTEQGCPPVIELKSDMRWVVWGAKLTIVQFVGVAVTVLLLLLKAAIGHMQAGAMAETNPAGMMEDAENR
jgi:hypothetical protein